MPLRGCLKPGGERRPSRAFGNFLISFPPIRIYCHKSHLRHVPRSFAALRMTVRGGKSECLWSPCFRNTVFPHRPFERSGCSPSMQPAAKPCAPSPGREYCHAPPSPPKIKKRPRKGAFHHISPRIRMTRMRMGRMNWKYGFSQRGIFMPLPLFTSSM